MISEEASKDFESIPLSAKTVKRRIVDMSDDIEEQTVERIKKSPYFAIQLDESTDVSNFAELLVFARYWHENKFIESLLFCKALKLTTTGEDVFNVINDYFDLKNLDWKKCEWACTDGAPSMAGKIKGLAAKMKEVSPNMQWNHCSIHREALACKKMPEDLKDVLNDCVKTINMIKAKALNSRLFTAICEEMGKDHLSLLLHTEVRWLSRGRALARLYELRDEVVVFLERYQQNKLPTVRDEMQRLINRFQDRHFQLSLAYLVDIFDKLNVLNASMQGPNTNVFDTHFKVIGMKHKLKFYIAKVTKGDITIFPTMCAQLNQKNYKELQKI
jgi:hypothetical protein